VSWGCVGELAFEQSVEELYGKLLVFGIGLIVVLRGGASGVGGRLGERDRGASCGRQCWLRWWWILWL
jgi:hypothetical protein